MSVENELRDYINSLGCESSNKLQKPETDYTCPICNRSVPYFWLSYPESHEHENRWHPHLCVCLVQYQLSDVIKKYLDMNMVELAENAKEVRDEVHKIATKDGANNLFLEHRMAIAKMTHRNRKGYDSVWYWLFNCKTQEEATEILAEVEADQPKGEKDVFDNSNGQS